MTDPKPDCRKCVHRGTVPGSAHSCCNHPEAQKHKGGAGGLLALLGAGYDSAAVETAVSLGIRANPTGFRRGWFNWPHNFDPVWLDACDVFEAKEITDA